MYNNYVTSHGKMYTHILTFKGLKRQLAISYRQAAVSNPLVNVGWFHKTVRWFHQTVRRFHQTVRLFHQTVRRFHWTVRLFHQTVSSMEKALVVTL